MKPISLNSGVVLALCIFFIIFSSALSARPLEDRKALGAVKLNEITSGDSIFELMGVEDCVDDGDEECLKRRMMAEVHLDYIYTQHHKP